MNWWFKLIFCILIQFRKSKSYFKIFRWAFSKTGHGLLHHRTLKSSVSQEWIDELGWFFTGWNKFMETKSWLKIIWVGILKNGWPSKSAVYQEWIDNLSSFFTFWQWCNKIALTLYLWLLNAGVHCSRTCYPPGSKITNHNIPFPKRKWYQSPFKNNFPFYGFCWLLGVWISCCAFTGCLKHERAVVRKARESCCA